MGVFDPGSHGSTFGGNPLACAVAEAALDVLVDEDLCQRAVDLGRHMFERFQKFESNQVKEVRCFGLWAGIDVDGEARRFTEALRDEGFLVKETHVHTLRLAPPLVISREELDSALDVIERVLA